MIVEAALDSDTASRLLKSNKWKVVATVATAHGGPYPVTRDISEQDKKKIAAAMKLCVG